MKWSALEKSSDDPENSLWPLDEAISPLEFAIGWPDGMRILLDEGAEPANAILTAAQLNNQDSLLLLLDVQHSKPVTTSNILEQLWKFQLDTEITSVLVRAVKLRRQMLAQLALEHLPKYLHWQLGLSSGVLLDSTAFSVYMALIERGIEVPPALVVHNETPIYHHDGLLLSRHTKILDSLYENGFQDIDVEFRGRTPFQVATEFFEDIGTLCWFLSKGAEPKVYTRLKAFPGEDAFPLALNLSDWYLIHRHRYKWMIQNDAILSSIVARCASNLTTSTIDQCTCHCSTGGCLPIHCFRRATYHELDDSPDWKLLDWFDPLEPPRLHRVSRIDINDILLIWTESTHLSDSGIQDAYEAFCRLEMFERLGMAHTCLPHGVHPHLEPAEPLPTSEIQALQEEDKDTNHHLELLMQAYKRCRSMYLPEFPTAEDYSEHLEEWWDELEDILPEIDYDRDREDHIAEALGEAGYGGYLDDVQSSNSASSGIADFEDVIRCHFSHYLANDSSSEPGPGSDTENEWVTESEWESDT